MQSIYLNHFLNSLAFALLNSFWQMALLWMIYQFFITVFQTSAKHKYNILISTQFAGFLWFAITLLKSVLQNTQTIWQDFFVTGSYLTTTEIQKYLPVISVFYLFFFLVQLVKYLLQFFATSERIKSYKIYESSQWNLFTENVSFKLGIYKKVILKTTSDTVIPFTIGFIKPVIVIPVAALNNLSAQQLEAILIHELAHIKRHDYAVNLLLIFSEIVLCFNPFSRLINKEISLTRELCCDDVVVNYPYATTQYAQALLNIAKSQTQQQLIAGLGAINTKQDLLFRINRMFNKNDFSDKKLPKFQIGLAFIFGLLMFTSVGFINYKVKNIITVNKTELAVQNTFEQQLIKQVDNIQKTTISETERVLEVQKDFVKKKLVRAKKEISSSNQNSLCANRNIISEGFKDFARAINTKESFVASNKNDEIYLIDSINNNDFKIVNTVKQENQTRVEKFIIPATSQSAASAIVVTTTIKDDGSKITKIEIIKGNGRIE